MPPYTPWNFLYEKPTHDPVTDLFDAERRRRPNMPEITTCKVAEFEGYIDDAERDTRLEADMARWRKEHPEHHVLYQTIEPYGSSGYPLLGFIHYEECAFGRQYVPVIRGDSRVDFRLRNLDSETVVVLHRVDCIDGTIKFEVRGEDGSYYVLDG